MNTDLLFDPLFAEPFVTGLAFAILLPLLGAFLRLRDEWLAALAFAQACQAGLANADDAAMLQWVRQQQK